MSKNKNRKTENAPYDKNGMQSRSENKNEHASSAENKKNENGKN